MENVVKVTFERLDRDGYANDMEGVGAVAFVDKGEDMEASIYGQLDWGAIAEIVVQMLPSTEKRLAFIAAFCNAASKAMEVEREDG